MDWKSPIEGGKWGAPHTLDIPLAFDNIDKTGSLTGTSADAQKVADQVSETFIAFAKTGDPNGKGAVPWPAFTKADPRVQHIDGSVATGGVANQPDLEKLDADFTAARAKAASH